MHVEIYLVIHIPHGESLEYMGVGMCITNDNAGFLAFELSNLSDS